MRRSLLLLVALLVACADPPGMIDGGVDVVRTDMPDAQTDAGELRCAVALSEQRVALDPDGPRTQIHPAVAFDGDAVWVTYVRPEPGGGDFDVWATRRDCGGVVVTPPFAVQSDPAGNDIDPAIAIFEDRVLIAWQTDDGTGGTDNLQIRYRLFALDGTPMGDDRTLRTTRMGTAITDNHLGVRVAATEDGFVVAGARGVPELMRFSAYVQTLDADGTIVGDAFEPAYEMDVTQSAVAVTSVAEATYYAYDRDDGTETQVYAGLVGGPPQLALPDLVGSSGSDVLATDSTIWGALAAETSAGIDIALFDVLAGRSISIGQPSRVEHSPHLATSHEGDAMAYFRQIRGFTNELLVVPLTPALGESILVEIDVPSYQPALTHVDGHFWFVAYSIGTSPDFRLVGSFIELPAS